MQGHLWGRLRLHAWYDEVPREGTFPVLAGTGAARLKVIDSHIAPPHLKPLRTFDSLENDLDQYSFTFNSVRCCRDRGIVHLNLWQETFSIFLPDS